MPDQHPTTPAARSDARPSDPDATAPGTTRPTNSEFGLGAPAVPGELGALGPYRVLKELGRGGMGAVYRAIDTRLDRTVALKVLIPELAADPAARERFLREAKAAAKLSHDNVVTVYEADERDGVPYIAMQLLQGYPLDQYLKTKGAPPLAHVVRIGIEAARGLAAAHALGLVHRDIKPANLWLESPNGRVKVLDFGLAKPVGTDAELTKSGAVVGTPAFMSPEQARGLKVDHRTDIFSLGAVLYRVLAGRNPFAGANMMAVLMALGTEDPMPLRELNAEVPAALAELIHRMLAKKPEDRPQSAREVAYALRAVLAQPSTEVSTSHPVVVQAVPVAAPMEVSAVAASAFANLMDDDADAPTEHESEPVRESAGAGGSRKGLLLAGGVLALIAVVAVAVALGTGGKKPDDTAKGGDPVAVPPKPNEKNPPKKGGELPAVPAWKPIPVGESPFDKLDPNEIPKEERFDWQPKELVGVIGSHRGSIPSGGRSQLVFSPDGRWLFQDGRIWDAKTLNISHTLYCFGRPHFSADGKTMAIGGGIAVDLIDLSGDRPRLLKKSRAVCPPWTGNGVHGAALLPNGKYVVAGAGDGRLGIHTLDEGTEYKPHMILREQTKSPSATSYNVMVTPDGKRVGAICGEPPETNPGEFQIRFWDISGNAPRELFSIPYKLKATPSADLSPDGKTLWVTAWQDNWLEAYDVSGEKAQLLDKADCPGVIAVAGFVKDGQSVRVVVNGGMQLWQLVDGKLKKTRDFPEKTITVNDDLTQIVTVNGEPLSEYMNVCDMTGKVLVQGVPAAVQTFERHAIPFVAENHVYTTASPLRSWEVKGGRFSVAKESKRQPGGHASLSPDQKLISWRVDTGIHVIPRADFFSAFPFTGTFIPVPGYITPYCWAADSKTIYVSTPDGDVSAWDLLRIPATSRPIAKGIGPLYVLTASRDGRYLAGITQKNELYMLDPTGKKLPVQLAMRGNNSNALWARFTPDGTALIATSHSGQMFRYTVDKPLEEPVLVLEPPEPAQLKFEISPDGKVLVTGDGGTLRWYDATVTPMKLHGEWKQFASSQYFELAPDSRHVVLEQVGMLYVLRLPDSVIRKVAVADADRKAAEWVLFLGGLVRVNVNGEEREVKAAADMPKDQFTLTWVDLYHKKQVTDSELEILRGIKTLKGLILVGTQVTDAGLAKLPDCADLVELQLELTGVTDAGLARFAKCKNLQTLNLSQTPVTDEGFAHFKGCKSIVSLAANHTKLTDNGLALFKEHKGIASLHLGGTAITDTAIDQIKAYRELVNLNVGGTRVTDAGLAHLKDCKQLSGLGLNGTGVTDVGLAHLRDCKQLSGLSLNGTGVTDVGLAHLRDCKQLSGLGLEGTKVTDVGLAHLKSCNALKGIVLKGTKVTAKGLAEFHAAVPGCLIQHDGGVIEPGKK